jgi:hypothetical protein
MTISFLAYFLGASVSPYQGSIERQSLACM